MRQRSACVQAIFWEWEMGLGEREVGDGELPFTGLGNTVEVLTGTSMGILTAPLVMHMTHTDREIRCAILEPRGTWAADVD